MKSGFMALKILVRPSIYTFTESTIRNALYLWLVSRTILVARSRQVYMKLIVEALLIVYLQE